MTTRESAELFKPDRFAPACLERILRNLNQPATTPKRTHPAKNAVVSFGGPHYVGRITAHEGETDG